MNVNCGLNSRSQFNWWWISENGGNLQHWVRRKLNIFLINKSASFYFVRNNTVLRTGIIWFLCKESCISWYNSPRPWAMFINFLITYSFDGLHLIRLTTHDMVQTKVLRSKFPKQGSGMIALILIPFHLYTYSGKVSKLVRFLDSFHGRGNVSTLILVLQGKKFVSGIHTASINAGNKFTTVLSIGTIHDDSRRSHRIYGWIICFKTTALFCACKT